MDENMATKVESKALRLLKPGYTPRKSRDIKEYAKIYSTEMIDVLVEIATDTENFPRDRIQAAEAVINRGYGKPGNAADEDDFQDAIHVEKLTTQQLTKMLAELPQTQEPIVEVSPKEMMLIEASHEESESV